MSDYQDWSLDGWRTHLPGVPDVPDYWAAHQYYTTYWQMM